MKLTRTKLAIVGAAIGSLSLFVGAGTSSASPGGAVVVGNGTISPGLTLTPTAQSVSFSGTAVVAHQPGTGTYSCTFSGSSSIAETIQNGQGTATGSCSGAQGTITASVNYTRNGGVVRLTGTANGSGIGGAHSLTAGCSFEPTSAQPIRSYQLQCAVAVQ